MTLHLICLPVSRRGFALWARDRGFGPKGTQDDGAVLHTLLSGLFGKGAFQPFRLFMPEQSDGSLYGYAQSDAAALREMAQLAATPDMLEAVTLDRLRSKPMPALRASQRLGFDVRIRPVRRLTDGKRVRERDAFISEAFRNHADDLKGMAAGGRSRETVYRDWLVERLPGVQLESARLARFQRSRILRHGNGIEGPDATFHGTLKVIDPPAFIGALAQGIGRHRAYGFGMLMLRPPDAAVPER